MPRMAVPGADPPYDLADVPYVMYFHDGYGLHGGYWHDDYGVVRSNGCVNLSLHDASWLFRFSSPRVPEYDRTAIADEEEPGTWIYVHEGE
jgi:lipoprotein-anchoring transpeptidase ErfK/SrfK